MRVLSATYRSGFHHALLAGVVLGLLALGGCAGSGQSQSAETMTINNVIQQLRQQGLRVSPGEQLSNTGFANDALRLNTERGDRIVVYEFQNSSSASMEVSRKPSSAGSPPFYYQKANIMAEHRGTDPKVASALEAVLGPKQ
jgi:hypothetical protein